MIKRLQAYPMIILLLPLVVAILFSERAGWLYPSDFEGYDSLRVYSFVLTSSPRETKKCWRYETEQKVLLYVLRDSTRAIPRAGDTIMARTRIKQGGQIGQFDYGLYLKRQGIIGSAYVRNYQLLATDNPPKEPLQKRLYGRLAAAGLHSDELGTTAAMTLGYKEDLDPTLRRQFQASGAAHVLAVSGLHTGIIYGLLLWLLTFGGRLKPLYENRAGRWTLSAVIVAVMWFYAWLTGMTPSVVRAVLMVTIFEVARMAYRQAISLNTIAAAAVLILLVRPLDLWSVSFQLSFAATSAIVLVAHSVEYHWQLSSLKDTIFGRVVDAILGVIIISLAAQLGTLPITMYTFGQFSTYFLLTNLIVLPIASLLVPCGLASVALGGTWLGVFVGKITGYLAWAMNHAVGWIESLPMSTIPVSIGLGMVAVYYGLWIAEICILRTYRIRL